MRPSNIFHFGLWQYHEDRFLLTLRKKTRNLQIIAFEVFYSNHSIRYKLKKKPFDSLSFGIDCKFRSKIKKRKQTVSFLFSVFYYLH